MLTGRFDADNWILAHLGPLAASRECSRLWMVSSSPVPPLPKVEAIYPPKWLARIAGGAVSRLLVFAWSAIRKRPHFVGGFHITFNGMAAAIVARLAGARSMYFCVGGPAEIQDGGVRADDHAFAKMKIADPLVEKRLIGIVSRCDAVVTMGTRAVTFLRGKGVQTAIHVVSGGIDSQRFRPADEAPSLDLILTGRLARIKRMDVFLQAVRNVADRIPEVRAVIVGDGPLREELCLLSAQIGVERNVEFVGRQHDVENWLRRSKIFVLTSDSEGLSLAMMEAMMCGLPAIVSDVGDLGDLVEDGVNGYLVPRRSPELFAERIVELLLDERKRAAFSLAARRSALRYETQATVRLWDTILGSSQRQTPTA
ncbi:MAG: glycosyltransferase [Planctomycetes bacterium]|jgi:glycosyltransferase involved in cell wall biosynthesis|nr:glycosyltransferase [Planctomycetota bacterium]